MANKTMKGKGILKILGIMIVFLLSLITVNATVLGNYSFDNDNLSDSSGNNYDGVNHGTTNVSGKFNEARDFDGSSWINLTGLNEMNNASQLTVSGWFKQDTLNVVEFFYFRGPSADYTNVFGLWSYTDGNMYIETHGAGNRCYIDYSLYMSANTWTHIAVVFNGSGSTNTDKVKIYFDGVSRTPTCTGTILSTISDELNDELTLGTREGGLYLNGAIDEFLIRNVSLNADEVFQEYNYTEPTYGGSLSISYPLEYNSYQRNNTNQSSMTIKGSYTGTPGPLEARFNNGTWQTLTTSLSGGVFSGNITGLMGQGILEVRAINNNTISNSVNNVSVGDIYIIAGQSNHVAFGQNAQVLNSSNPYISTVFRGDGIWMPTEDPISYYAGAVYGTGSAFPLLANLMTQKLNVPISFISTAWGGAEIESWQKGNLRYENFYDVVNRATNGTMKAKGVLFFQGESDAYTSYNTPYSTYLGKLNNMTNSMFQDTDIEKVFVGQIGTINNGQSTRTQLDIIRKAQRDSWNQLNNISVGVPMYDVTATADNLHFTTDTELLTMAKRWFYILNETLYDSGTGRSAIATNLIINKTDNSIFTINFNSTKPFKISKFDGTTGSKVEGFYISNGGTALTDSNVVSTTIQNNSLIVDLDTNIDETYNLDYGSFNDAVGKSVLRYDDFAEMPIETIFDLSFTLENSLPVITSNSSGTTNENPISRGEVITFNVTGIDIDNDLIQMKVCSNSNFTWNNCDVLTQNLTGVTWSSSNISILAQYTTNEITWENTAYIILYDSNEYINFTLNYYVNQIPNTSNFNMQDILGGQTYFYGETIDYFRINVNDTEDNISGLNAQITVTKANGTIAVNSVNMTDLTSITKEYSPNVYLDVRGVWNVSIVVTDSNSGSTTYNTNFTVQNNLPEISNATIDLISLNGRNQTWNFQFDYSDFENDNLTTCGLYIDNTNISQNGSGSSCNFNVSYALNESIFNTQIFVIDSEGGISTNGGNYTLASLVYDRIESSEQVGNLTIQYFNKYYNITNPNANYSNISFSYESDLSREINLTTGTSSQWTYFDTNLIEYGSYDYIRDVLNTYTVNAGESVFRYFNVTGNLSTGENVPGFNISLQTQNYIAGTQNMNFSATNTSNYADYTNFTSDQTMNAYIQPLNNGVTDFYYYDYKAKIVYSNSIINSTHADNVRTYYFQNEDSNNYGRKVQFMFDNLRNASVKVYDIIAFSTLTGWTSKLDSTQVVYRYDGSSYNQLTSGVDYTYTVNTGSEQVEFYFNPLITPLTNNFIDLSWSVYEEGGTITPTPAPSGGGGGGGSSSTPSTDLSTGKIVCDVFVTPKTMSLDDSELLQELRIKNDETFGFDPEFSFQYVSGDSDLVDKLRITNELTLVDSGKEALTGVRLSTFFLSSGEAKANLVISSTKCVDIKVPIEISIEQSSGVAEIINEVAGENKTLSEVVVDLSDKSFFGKDDTSSGTIPVEKSFFEKAIDKTFSVLGLTIVIGLLMLIVVIPTGNNPKRYSENNFLDITARFVIWAVVTGIGGIVILVFHIMFFS